MKHQLDFLLCLGAYENHNMCPDKSGFTSDMYAYPDNEKLWREAGQAVPLADAVFDAIYALGLECLDVAVDGTLFPPEHGQYAGRWAELIRKACEEVELEIRFDGCSFEEAMAISCNKELFEHKLICGELPVTYSMYRAGRRCCLLTDKQARELAVMSVRFNAYTYRGDAYV